MSEHLVQTQIEGYCRRKLSVADLLRVSDHLAACEMCRQQVERALNGDAVFLALRSQLFDETPELPSGPSVPEHLSFEQTARYIEGESGGEELQVINDHLSACGQCKLAVSDLRAFREQVEPGLRHEHRPARARPSADGWWRRMAAVVISRFPGSRPLIAGAALAALVLMWAGWAIWRTMQENVPIRGAVSTSQAPAMAPASASPVIARLDDSGGIVTLDRAGALAGVDSLPPAYRLMVKEGLTDQRLEKPSFLAALSRPGGSLMGSNERGNQFLPSDPFGKVVLSDRPIFRWTQLKGAAAYVVEIYDGNFSLLTASPQISGTSWTAAQPLRRGTAYSWQVTAFKDGREVKSPRPPAPQAQFYVLDQARADEILRAQRDYASSHMLLGLLYARAGLLDEAEQELQTLQRRNPDSAIVRRLSASLEAMRR